MSSQLHSGFIWALAVAHLLLPWFRVTSLSQSSILAKRELGNSFCSCIFCQKGGGTLPIFIGASLSEPHTRESNGAIFIHYYQRAGVARSASPAPLALYSFVCSGHSPRTGTFYLCCYGAQFLWLYQKCTDTEKIDKRNQLSYVVELLWKVQFWNQCVCTFTFQVGYPSYY